MVRFPISPFLGVRGKYWKNSQKHVYVRSLVSRKYNFFWRNRPGFTEPGFTRPVFTEQIWVKETFSNNKKKFMMWTWTVDLLITNPLSYRSCTGLTENTDKDTVPPVRLGEEWQTNKSLTPIVKIVPLLEILVRLWWSCGEKAPLEPPVLVCTYVIILPASQQH